MRSTDCGSGPNVQSSRRHGWLEGGWAPVHAHCVTSCKTVRSLENTCHTWALLRWWFSKRRFIKFTFSFSTLLDGATVCCCGWAWMFASSYAVIEIKFNLNKLCARPHDMSPPLYAARCSPAPAHTRVIPVASSAPCAMNIHYRFAAACFDYDYGVVHIKYVVTWAANQSDLDLWPFDPESSVRVTRDVGYLCSNFSLPKLLCSRLKLN